MLYQKSLRLLVVAVLVGSAACGSESDLTNYPLLGMGRTVRFEDRGDTFLQKSAQLEWQKSPAPNDMAWEPAKAYCAQLTLSGSGWRLPSKEERLALYADKQEGAAAFPGMNEGWYWSSSPFGGNANSAWDVDFGGGSAGNGGVGSGRVRCVR